MQRILPEPAKTAHFRLVKSEEGETCTLTVQEEYTRQFLYIKLFAYLHLHTDFIEKNDNPTNP